MAVGLAMADDGLDGGAPPKFAFDLPVNATLLARFEDPERLWRIVTHIALVHIGASISRPVSASVSSMTSRRV